MGVRPRSRREALLYQLCVNHGWCGASLKGVDLAEARDADAVLRAILAAEDMEPESLDRVTCAKLTRIVEDWLFDPHGRGARSGLPD